MGKFTKISLDAFNKMQFDAGVVLSEFNPQTPGTAEAMLDKILFATTGDITFTATPTFTDMGEDVNNCPNNMMEFKKLEQWEVALGGTAVTLDTKSAKLLLGAADITENKVTPRNTVKLTDYADIWWVADYGEAGKEGFVAVHLKNALSTGGFALTAGKNAKGKVGFTISGHYKLAAQDEVPFDIYLYTA